MSDKTGDYGILTVSRKSWIDPTHRDEYARVDYSRDTSVGRGSDADNETDSDNAHQGEDVGRSLTGAVREPGYGDGENGGGDVDGDG